MTSRPADDPVELTRSEQHLLVGTEWVVAGRVRLRRLIVTETRTVEVTVRREVVEISGATIDFRDGRLVGVDPDGPRVDPPEIASPFVAVLREEVPVVTTRVRPYERVVVTTERVLDSETVRAALRHEQVDVDLDPR